MWAQRSQTDLKRRSSSWIHFRRGSRSRLTSVTILCCYCLGFFLTFYIKFQSTLDVAAMLFCCEAAEMFCGPWNFTWLSIDMRRQMIMRVLGFFSSKLHLCVTFSPPLCSTWKRLEDLINSDRWSLTLVSDRLWNMRILCPVAYRHMKKVNDYRFGKMWTFPLIQAVACI